MLPSPAQALASKSWIDELHIDVDISPSATEDVVINAPAGEHQYFCSVPKHKQAGRLGTLIGE